MRVIVSSVLEAAVFGVLVLGVLVRMRVRRSVAVDVLVFVADVLVRMLVARPIRVGVFVGVFFCCHSNSYSLYTN